jgi:hypothetical protein
MMTELRRVACGHQGRDTASCDNWPTHGLHVIITARAEHVAQAAARDLSNDSAP